MWFVKKNSNKIFNHQALHVSTFNANQFRHEYAKEAVSCNERKLLQCLR